FIMQRLLYAGVFALSGLVVLASQVPARALLIAPPPPGPQRVTKADAIVVGRVVALEDKDVEVNKVAYRVAVINVTEVIKGAKEQMVRVGFIPQGEVNPGGVRPIRPGIGRFGNVQFQVGQDGLFFLSKGPEGKFFTAPMYYDFVASQNGDFKQQISAAKLAIKIGDNPM